MIIFGLIIFRFNLACTQKLFSASEETIAKWIGENLPDIYDLILHVKNEDLPFLSNGKHDGHKLITGISNAAFTE